MKAGTPSAKTLQGAGSPPRSLPVCPVGHPRYPFTRSQGCNTCKAQVIAAKRRRELEHAQKVAGTAEGVKKAELTHPRRLR
jgi:hypothetical protein